MDNTITLQVLEILPLLVILFYLIDIIHGKFSHFKSIRNIRHEIILEINIGLSYETETNKCGLSSKSIPINIK